MLPLHNSNETKSLIFGKHSVSRESYVPYSKASNLHKEVIKKIKEERVEKEGLKDRARIYSKVPSLQDIGIPITNNNERLNNLFMPKKKMEY